VSDLQARISGAPTETIDLGTPVAIVDVTRAEAQLDAMQEAFVGYSVFYAIKSNRDRRLLEALSQRDVGFEIASWTEGELLLSVGVTSDRIIFSNPVKVPDHIARAYRAGVRCFAADSARELNKLANLAPGSDVLLRLAVSDHGSAFPLSSKFGCRRDEVLELARLAQSTGLNFRGLTFHVGSQAENLLTWEDAIRQTGEVLSDLLEQGTTVGVVDIGGGFPVAYCDPRIGETVSRAIADSFPYTPSLWAEPGRYISAPCTSIITQVIGRETRDGREWLYIDMGVFQGLMECLELSDWSYPIGVERVAGDPAAKPIAFVLTGPTCDAYDTISERVLLPESVEVGDLLKIDVAGAYTLEYASSFNGFEPPEVHYW
jgi:ornithine decarboxylase